MLWERCLAMAFILRKPSSPCQITNPDLSGPRGTLHCLASTLRQRRLEAYGVALLVVALATLLRFPLVEPLAGAAPFITYTLAIIVVALVCGFLPGIMALALSVLTGWFLFLPPRFSFAL